MEDKNCLVTNRSTSTVIYKIPDKGLRRVFAPNEVKKNIKFSELEELAYQPGGLALIRNYLLVRDPNAVKELDLHVEPEYNYTKDDIIELMKNGSLDQFLDCLDFAPVGVIDIIKELAVQLPLDDLYKRKALYDKTGFDVSKVLDNAEKGTVETTAATTRRVETAPKIIKKE